ncbi:MAG: 50S ribosomal protein L27 [Candidatus Omnitrophota bacterium]
MTRLGGLSTINYKETKGMKVSGGQVVKAGTILTREGHRWQPGINVDGRTSLTASCDGEVYFTRKRGSYRRAVTLINIKPKALKEAKK